MYKRLFIALAVAIVAFSSCNKQEFESQDTTTEKSGLVVHVSIPQTKLAYEETVSGLSLELKDGKDRLIAYFRNSGGSMIGEAVTLNLDPTTISGDKKSGTFKSASPVAVPAEAETIFFYLDNEDNGMYSLTGASINDLRAQDGTLDDVSKHQVIVGTATIASMSRDGNGDYIANISFSYRTSVLKLTVTFPVGINPSADENTTITITDNDVYNSVRVAWGEPYGTASENKKGAISVHPCYVFGQDAVAYVTVWGGSEFEGATITGDVGGVKCSVDFDAAAATVAGKVHRVARTLEVASTTVWKNDASGTINYAKGLTQDTATSGISYSSGTGVISYSANDTGKPRAGSITFAEGQTVNITQLDVDDFKGSWSFKAKTFAGANGLGLASGNTTSRAVTFGDPLGSETLDDVDSGRKGITNNIGISGLFGSAIMNAFVGIDYAATKLYFGIFFDGRSAQSVPANNATYPYVFFVPELGAYKNDAWFGTNTKYNFCLYPLGSPQNYGWIWFEANASFTQLTYGTEASHRWFWDVPGSGEATRCYVIGISVVASKSATPSAETMKATNTAGSYEYIYQANYSNSGTNGFYFSR